MSVAVSPSEQRGRGLDQLTLGELRDDLAERLAQREGVLYRRQRAWAERVEDMIDALEGEITRRDAQARVGL